MLVDYFNLQFMFKYLSKDLPSSFNNMWQRNMDRRPAEDQPNLRNNEELHIPFSRLSSSDKFPFYNLPRLWCNFEENSIKMSPNKQIFNIKLKELFIDNLSADFICTRLFCHACHLPPT